jgi:hypothetical protein
VFKTSIGRCGDRDQALTMAAFLITLTAFTIGALTGQLPGTAEAAVAMLLIVIYMNRYDTDMAAWAWTSTWLAVAYDLPASGGCSWPRARAARSG